MKLLNLPPLKRRERPFEYRLRDRLKRSGIMFIKLKPTVKGFPDRMAIAPMNRIRLVETKREKGILSPTQALVQRDLKRYGVVVINVEGPDVERAARIIERSFK